MHRATHFSLAGVLTAALCVLGCGPNIKLPSPLLRRESDLQIQVPVSVHVSPAARSYAETGWVNVVRYRVDFGDSLEANVADAYGRAFSEVAIADEFPPAGAKSPRLAFDVEIAGSDVSPGMLTFLSSSAEVSLRARIAVDGVTQPAPIEVRGHASASPGGLGALPGPNQGAYDQALQIACEGAMRDALEKLVDASIARARSIPK